MCHWSGHSWGLGFRVQGLGFRVSCHPTYMEGRGELLSIHGLGFRMLGHGEIVSITTTDSLLSATKRPQLSVIDRTTTSP